MTRSFQFTGTQNVNIGQTTQHKCIYIFLKKYEEFSQFSWNGLKTLLKPGNVVTDDDGDDDALLIVSFPLCCCNFIMILKTVST